MSENQHRRAYTQPSLAQISFKDLAADVARQEINERDFLRRFHA